MRSETEAALRAASIAQRIADSRIGADQVQSKGGIDLATATDVACEDAIRSELLRAFPEYPVIGEERGGTPDADRPYWLVDPICGTRPYASNVPLYCTNIALVENGIVTAAAIGVGRTGEIVYAEIGSGAWLRANDSERRLSVSAHSNTIWIDGYTESAANAVHRSLTSKRWYVWQFSSTVAYAYLSDGRISGILHFASGPQPSYGSVHTAAGCFIAQEAGAIVTDLNTGKPWNLETCCLLLGSTPELHRDLFQLVHA